MINFNERMKGAIIEAAEETLRAHRRRTRDLDSAGEDFREIDITRNLDTKVRAAMDVISTSCDQEQRFSAACAGITAEMIAKGMGITVAELRERVENGDIGDGDGLGFGLATDQFTGETKFVDPDDERIQDAARKARENGGLFDSKRDGYADGMDKLFDKGFKVDTEPSGNPTIEGIDFEALADDSDRPTPGKTEVRDFDGGFGDEAKGS